MKHSQFHVVFERKKYKKKERERNWIGGNDKRIFKRSRGASAASARNKQLELKISVLINSDGEFERRVKTQIR